MKANTSRKKSPSRSVAMVDTWDVLLVSLSRVFKAGIQTCFSASFPVVPSLFVKPPQTEMGDLAFVCFPLAAIAKKSPNVIATELAAQIKTSKTLAKLPIESITAEGPYINIVLKSDALAKTLLPEILSQSNGINTTSKNKKHIMVEFSQANTHKAFHIGHVRGTVLGESIARILETTGNSVVRANYQGDSGMHVAKWIWCYQKYHSSEPLRKEESWIASIYVDAVKKLAETPDFQKEVEEINLKLDEGSDAKLNKLWQVTRQNSLDAFEPIYKDLSTHFDEYFFESHLEKQGKQLVKKLVGMKIAKISNGATIMDLEKYNLGVWVLLRSDGTVLYSTKDLALAETKFKKHKIDTAIYVVGSEQSLHLQQLFKTLSLMKFKQAKNCHHVPVYEVRLPTGKMSSRTGDNILYSDFKKELTSHMKDELKKRYSDLSEKELDHRALTISIAALKYSMLKQDAPRPIVFIKEEALRFEGDTGPYLLYTYARFHSILTKGKYHAQKKWETDYIFTEEKNLLTQLAVFPQEVSKAAQEYNPAIIARYAYSLAKCLNEYYHTVPILKAHDEERTPRMIVIDATLRTMQQALKLLGITTLEQM